MRSVIITKAGCRDKSDGHHEDTFGKILSAMGIFPFQEQYDKIESIKIFGEINLIVEDEKTEYVPVIGAWGIKKKE